jgi:hypothetical protein
VNGENPIVSVVGGYNTNVQQLKGGIYIDSTVSDEKVNDLHGLKPSSLEEEKIIDPAEIFDWYSDPHLLSIFSDENDARSDKKHPLSLVKHRDYDKHLFESKTKEPGQNQAANRSLSRTNPSLKANSVIKTSEKA